MKNLDNSTIKKAFILVYLAFISLTISAQLNIATIDRTDGVLTAKHTLDSVKGLIINTPYSDYDYKNDILLYCSRDTTLAVNQFYYELYDIKADSLISKTFNGLNNEQVIGLKFQQSTGDIYGIFNNLNGMPPSQSYSFVKIDPRSGIITTVSSLPVSQHIRNNQSHHIIHEDSLWYTFKTQDSLFSIDILTGEIQHKVWIPSSNGQDNLYALEYDDSTSTVYGLFWNQTKQLQYIVSLDLATGTFTTADSLPEVLGGSVISPTNQDFVIDAKNRLFIFKAQGLNDTTRLFSVSLNNGQIISSPIIYDHLRNQNANRFYYLHADLNGNIYTISPMNINVTTSVKENVIPYKTKIYPNPFKDFFTINFEKEMNDIQVQVYSSTGLLIKRLEYKKANQIEIEMQGLAKGIYIVNIRSDKMNLSKTLIAK